jgi:hypothetical protein
MELERNMDGDVIRVNCDCDMSEYCSKIVEKLIQKHTKGDNRGYTFDCPLKLIRVKKKKLESESPMDVKIVEAVVGNEEE